mmetsp:Transcript_37049/g.66693  ORF Transcript_37049/g.66693 Transcript_37049/m.66693 type:complete len:1161 (+) Transcript_37049:84-3566(+)
MVSFANDDAEITAAEKNNDPTAGTGDEATPEHESQPPQSIGDMIHSHFDSFQHDGNGSASSSATRVAAALRSDILSATLLMNVNDDVDDDTPPSADVNNEETTTAILHCIDSAFACIATSTSKKESWTESITSILELAAAFSCTAAAKDENAGVVARAVIARAAEFSVAEKDVIRTESCRLIGLCVGHLVEGGRPAASILKKKGSSKKKKQVAVASNNGSAADLSGWKTECLVLAATALLPRVTDKIAKVRSASISACASLFSNDAAKLQKEEEFAEISNSLQSTLLWILANDSSAANRALVAQILPTSATSTEEEEEEENNIPAIIERIKDVDVKVREAALDSLRDNVHFEEHLTEDQRVEILRMGLTKRCPATYAKTVELLCCNWLKATKFDPILLLDHLNPVLNETVCEQAAQVLLRVASTIECETCGEKGVQLVQKHFGGPEIRSMRELVLRKRSIVPTPVEKDDDVEKDADDEEDNEKEDTPSSPSLSPSLALFLRIKCDLSTNKSSTISEIITDIPTLCNLLNSHIETLIEFNNSDDYDELDEDDIAAFEDDQNFLCLQLIYMAKSSEVLEEEGSRRHFLSIMRRVLARLATPDDLVEACVKAMAAAHDKESQFLQTISEILVDVEDDDTFHSNVHDEKAIVIVRQMRIIAILSIVLESISAQMVSHPILDGFFQHLSPAITSKNAIVREHGVICLSKFCLLSDEEKVMAEFKPLLMTIAGSVEERVEVRAQAALALCDLALIHEKMLVASDDSNDDEESGGADTVPATSSIPFKDMLLEMLGHAKPGIVIIAAEITAKLLLAGRLHDPTLIAHLLLIYFDTTLISTAIAEYEEEDDIFNDDSAEVVKQVGSPVRLQQLLSIFFPTYSMSSLDANDDMMSSVGPLLTIVNEKLSGMKQADGKAMMVQKWPIAKMVEYVCYTVDLADKKKNEESEKKAVKENKKEVVETVNDGESTIENTEDHVEEAENDEKADVDAADDDVVEASSTLLASIEIAEFLSEEGGCDTAPTFYIRALAKILGSASIDIDAEDRAVLRRLKSNVSEAEYANDDGPTVKSIKKLAKLLVDVEDHSEEEEEIVPVENDANDGEDNDGDEVPKEEEDTALNDANNDSTEKENPTRPSVGSIKSSMKKNGAEGDDRRTSFNRASLADVNCY